MAQGGGWRQLVTRERGDAEIDRRCRVGGLWLRRQAERDGQTPFSTTAALDETKSAPTGNGTGDGNVDRQVLTSLSRLLVWFRREDEDGRERWGAGGTIAGPVKSSGAVAERRR